jgi:hypothetical protein
MRLNICHQICPTTIVTAANGIAARGNAPVVCDCNGMLRERASLLRAACWRCVSWVLYLDEPFMNSFFRLVSACFQVCLTIFSPRRKDFATTWCACRDIYCCGYFSTRSEFDEFTIVFLKEFRCGRFLDVGHLFCCFDELGATRAWSKNIRASAG